MLLCPQCGGRFEVLTNGRYRYYVCATRRHAGTARCSNSLALRVEKMDEWVLGLLDREVLHPKFVDHVVNLACGNGTHDPRAAIKEQLHEVNAKIERLAGVMEAMGDEQEPILVARLRARRAERDALNRRLDALAEPIDRAALRAALEQRRADWHKRLRSDFPDEARYVVQQLIGPLELVGIDRPEDLFGHPEDEAALAALEAAGIDIHDQTGKSIFAELGLKAYVRPGGLLNGLVADSFVAGAGLNPLELISVTQ